METTERTVRRGIALTEEQWRLVKAHAAQRGQTISEWFRDIVYEAGLGRPKYPPVQEVSNPAPVDQSIRPATPAPKPAKKR